MGFGLLTGVVAFVGTSGVVAADTKPNPYDPIVERNPFGLKPPPPPPDPSTNAPPPVPTPTAQVEVTGITSILSSKRVLLEVIPAPGKPMLKPILSEGERIESVEVMAINVEKNEVTIKNGNIVTNLTFKVAKSTGPTAAPPIPGVVPPPAVPTPMPAPVQTSYNQSQGSGRYAVMMAGGNSSTPQNPNPAVPNAYGSSANFGNPGLSGGTPAATGGGATDGFRQIPSRNIRTATPQNANPDAAVSREQQYRSMEQQRLVNEAVSQISGKQFPPLPPTPYTPADAPAGRTPPPIPGFPPAPGR
jgi:hypothetical protein